MGTVSTGLEFQHADGTPYGHAVSPASVDAQTDAYAALRSFGFRESETRRALEAVRRSPGVDGSDVGSVVRAALRVLTPSAAAKGAREPRVEYRIDRACKVSSNRVRPMSPTGDRLREVGMD